MNNEEALRDLRFAMSDSADLISLYIHPTRPVDDIIAQLRNEKQIASHIKSAKLKEHIQTQLDFMLKHLEDKRTPLPENGVALFCGHFGKDNALRLYMMHPNKPIDFSLYRCDDHFTIRDVF